MKIKRFRFSPFDVNTYILYDKSKECVIIDAACYIKKEEEMLSSFIKDNRLKPVRILNTHCHLDHVFGNKYTTETYNLPVEAHKEENSNNLFASQAAENYGLVMAEPPKIGNFITEKDTIKFGHSELEIRLAPGHTKGSLLFYAKEDNFIISGDVLFKDSIGRTDLPGGNFDVLKNSIVTQLYTLDDNVTVYSGHGPATEIGYEKMNNPFITF